MCEGCPAMIDHNKPGNPSGYISRADLVREDGYPNYDSPLFKRENPCHSEFMDCEGDCSDCPNKLFFDLYEEVR